MGGMIGYGTQQVGAGPESGVTITGTGGQSADRRDSNGDILGLTPDEWLAVSAVLNSVILLLTLGVMLSEV
jgi:hypothetical protein